MGEQSHLFLLAGGGGRARGRRGVAARWECGVAVAGAADGPGAPGTERRRSGRVRRDPRRYHCRNTECVQKTFSARGDLVGPHQRWTERFQARLEQQIVDMDLKTNAQILDISYRQIRAREAELIARAEQVAWYEEQVIKEAATLQVGLDEHSPHRRHK